MSIPNFDQEPNQTDPELSLEENLEFDIQYYGTDDSDYGRFMVDLLGKVLRRVQITGSQTVAEYLDRTKALEAES